MAQLAIKGHADRGEDVIKVLVSLGGKNPNCNVGKYINYIYYINYNGYIEATSNQLKMFDFTVLTLEEVEALMPYKIGDKILFEDKMYEIIGMKWHKRLEKIVYDAKGEKNKLLLFDPNDFTPVVNNEEFQNKLLKIYPDGKTGHIQLIPHKDYEIKEINGDFVIIKKQSKYPKTFEECCDVLGIKYDDYVCGYKGVLLRRLQQLLTCRDAYWKIAGKELGLGKTWKPDYNDCTEDKYFSTKFFIYVYRDEICPGSCELTHHFIVFPTAEMREAFYENFKDLIEECKELL